MKQEGVWVSENEADDKIHGKTNAKQRLLIRNQIIFHSKLLGSPIPNKSLLKFQEKNEKFGTEKLLANLKAWSHKVNNCSVFVHNLNTST
jgi:hypothetical protein